MISIFSKAIPNFVSWVLFFGLSACALPGQGGKVEYVKKASSAEVHSHTDNDDCVKPQSSTQPPTSLNPSNEGEHPEEQPSETPQSSPSEGVPSEPHKHKDCLKEGP